MSVAELIGLLQDQNPEATVYVFGENNGHVVRTETVGCVVSGMWGPQPYVIISQDDGERP